MIKNHRWIKWTGIGLGALVAVSIIGAAASTGIHPTFDPHAAPAAPSSSAAAPVVPAPVQSAPVAPAVAPPAPVVPTTPREAYLRAMRLDHSFDSVTDDRLVGEAEQSCREVDLGIRNRNDLVTYYWRDPSGPGLTRDQAMKIVATMLVTYCPVR